MLLSIIIPFYNSAEKCSRLLNRLLEFNSQFVEVICVDDGSSDATFQMLEQFRSKATVSVRLVKQGNKGPGGARNTGLLLAKGEFVWFVDSDDDIYFSAVQELQKIYEHTKEFDFIDFDVWYEKSNEVVNSMRRAVGNYEVTDSVRIQLLQVGGRIFTKIFRRNFLIDNEIFYPENCIYEDNALTFIYQFHIKSFIKSGVCGYAYIEEHPSVTRSVGGVNPRMLDRIETSKYGLLRSLKLAKTYKGNTP